MYAGPGFYKHHKGQTYQVMGISTHTESGEVCVIYWPVKFPSVLCHRPIKMFNEYVIRNAEDMARFEFLGKELPK